MPPRFNEPVFVISVAARLVEMHPQTLRKYEREGLVEPSRTEGNLRMYSDRDIERLRQVKYLVEELGLNLAGVQLALQMTNTLLDMKERMQSMVAGIERGDGARARSEFARSAAGLEETLRMLGHRPLTPDRP